MQRARSDNAKDQRRQILLMAALDEFFDKGFNAARMEDIAARATLSKGTLYLYFDSKQALFKALIEDVAIPVVSDTLAQAANYHSAPQALQNILRSVARAIHTTPLPKLVKVIIADGRMFPELVVFYRAQVVDKMLGKLEALLAMGVANGEWHCDDTVNTARLIVAPILFSVIWNMVFAVNNANGRSSDALNIDSLFDLHFLHINRILSLKPELNHE